MICSDLPPTSCPVSLKRVQYDARAMAEGRLHRTLRLPQATALVVGTIIGSAVFVQASEVTHHVPNITGVLLVWVVSGVLTLFGALACAELATAFPRSGGVYVFLPRNLFAAGRLSLGLGDVLGDALGHHRGDVDRVCALCGCVRPARRLRQRVVAVAAIPANSAINYAGVKRSSTLQTTHHGDQSRWLSH